MTEEHGADRSVAQAIDALRRGWRVTLSQSGAAVTLISLELADAERINALDALGAGPAALLITRQRAAAPRLANQASAHGGDAVCLTRPFPGDAARGPVDAAAAGQLQAIADPVQDLAMPLKGPFYVTALSPGQQMLGRAALQLTKWARLLPGVLAIWQADAQAAQADAAAVLAHDAAETAGLRIAARAQLPLADAPQSQVVAFRSDSGEAAHLALIVGRPVLSRPVLTRLHSECFTGDLLASLKCDCGPQLRGALQRLAQEPDGGVLLYVGQEGRGIGLVNKLRAYALQDQGFDTVDANLRLGFEDDERSFAPAARMLSLLGIGQVRLLTNNPAKLAGLEAAGIAVTERVPHALGENPHNLAYLATKRRRSGHLL